MEWTSGVKFWCINDRYHRDGGPAKEFANGHKEWWMNGKRHRDDGPAEEHIDGRKEWWINGEECGTEEVYSKTIKIWKMNEAMK